MDPGHHPEPAPVQEAGATAPTPARPGWWRRPHPVLTPLSGFYAGLVLVLLVPVGLLSLDVSDELTAAQQLAPPLALTVLVPLVLILVRRTRRFGGYMLLGTVSTVVVVVGVATGVAWVMMRSSA